MLGLCQWGRSKRSTLKTSILNYIETFKGARLAQRRVRCPRYQPQQGSPGLRSLLVVLQWVRSKRHPLFLDAHISLGRAPLQPGFQPSLQPNLPTSLTGHSAPVRGGHGFLAPRGPFQFPPRGSSRPFVGRSRPSAPPSPYQANATFAARQDPNMSTTNYRPVFYPTHSAHIPVSSHDNISGFDNRMHGLATPNPFEHPIPIPASTPTRPSFPIPGPSAAVRASLAESAAAYGWQSSANNTIDRNENEYSGSMLTRLIKDPATPNRVSRAIPIIDPNRRTQMGPRMTEGSPVATRTGGKESAEESDSGEEGSRKHERSVNA